MNRRSFIQLTAGLSALSQLALSCSPDKKIGGKIIGASSSIGHIIRDQQTPEPTRSFEKEIVIIGGGVSGLSAGRCMQANNISDFILLELESHTGGNASGGANELSRYPWGAHYIPIPNNELTVYHQFLEECNVIVNRTDGDLPVYNDLYLCFDPQERLYINGHWQDGLVPHYGVPSEETEQIERFLAQMDVFRHMKDDKGIDVFAIPVDASGSSAEIELLDKITMKDWLLSQGYTSKYLHEYVNYCSRDDFGTPHHLVSAWAGIHYFAARKGKGVNAQHSDVLTWPEGNGFLADHLKKNIARQIRTNAIAIKVQETEKGVEIDFMDTITHEVERIYAKQCILAVPQFVVSRILKNDQRSALVRSTLQYAPWMVANLKVNALIERSGAPLSWDNVLHGSSSLGYVEATHELLQQQIVKKNLTYYLPLTGSSPVEERKRAQGKTFEDWCNIIINDLKKIHPNIEEATEEINIMIWGHAMAQPLPGVIKGEARKQLAASIGNKIHFAHTDLAGISIFEEAFYQGITAAKKIIQAS